MTIKVEFIGKFFDNHSLSLVNRNLAINIAKHTNIDLYLTPIDSYKSENKLNKADTGLIKQLASKEIDAPDIQLRHTYPPVWRHPVSDKTKVVFIQPWEYTKVPFEWEYKWETFADALITPSKWTANIVLEAGLKPSKLFVIPNGYNSDIFNAKEEPSQFFNKTKFTFIYVGNHQYRKGLDILLNTWRDTFVKADNVQLFIKDFPAIYGANNIISQILQLQYHTDCGKILYNNDVLSDMEIANIYKNAKAIVHPFRGEGFGMHLQEAVACGTYPIFSNSGPVNEFVSDEIGGRISTQRNIIDLTNPNIFALKPGDSLSNMGAHAVIDEPDPESLKFNMRLIYFHHERNKLLNKVLESNNPNTWPVIAKQYGDVLNTLANEYETPKRFSS